MRRDDVERILKIIKNAEEKNEAAILHVQVHHILLGKWLKTMKTQKEK